MTLRPIYEMGPIWSCEGNTDIQLCVSVSDTRFYINLSAASFEGNSTLLEEYLHHVEKLNLECLSPLSTDPVEEIYQWATTPFTSLFQNIPPLDRKVSCTLQDCLFSRQFTYTLELVGDVLKPVELENASRSRPVGVIIPASGKLDNSIFPVYHPVDVKIWLKDDAVALPTTSRKVSVKRNDAWFFKQILPGDVNMTVRELYTYARIHSANFGPDVRISRLLGVVEDEASSRCVGLLLSYIECDTEANTLLSPKKGFADVQLRNKWLEQIDYSLSKLHAKSIVWGDAKPDNVLVDVHDDAYLIDFGGGFTNGWVDEDLAGTICGDLQGLQRIRDYTSDVLA